MTESARLRNRHRINNVMLSLTGVCTVVIASVLLFILGYLFCERRPQPGFRVLHAAPEANR